MNRYRQMEEMQRGWAPPRELRQSPPRQVGLNSGGIVLAVLGIVLLLGAVVGGPLLARESLRERANYRAVQSEGRDIDARVVRLWRKSGENKRTMVNYEFAVDGRIYRKDASVPSALWKALEKDGPIRVTYLPANPELNHVHNRPRRPLSIWVAVVVAAVALAVAGIIGRALWKSMELLTSGRVAPGLVTKVEETRTQHGVSRTVHYEFALLSGAIAKGKRVSDSKGPAAGGLVCVVYDPNHVRRNTLYPMQLVKVRKDT